MPQVNLYGKSHHNKNEKPRFYDDLMPNCEGLPNGWKFKIDHDFSLDASNKDEYYLHLNQNQVHIYFMTILVGLKFGYFPKSIICTLGDSGFSDFKVSRYCEGYSVWSISGP